MVGFGKLSRPIQRGKFILNFERRCWLMFIEGEVTILIDLFLLLDISLARSIVVILLTLGRSERNLIVVSLNSASVHNRYKILLIVNFYWI